jgi:hypothetical protein
MQKRFHYNIIIIMESALKEKSKHIEELQKFADKYGSHTMIVKNLTGLLVEDRFQLTGYLAQGSFGHIFKAIDTNTN